MWLEFRRVLFRSSQLAYISHPPSWKVSNLRQASRIAFTSAVSQPKPASEKSPYYDIAEKYGVKIDFRPFIKVESLSAKEFRQQKISVLDHTAVIFTSRHAIDHFFHLCTELRVTIPETMKYFCVTEAVALYIQKYVQYRKRKIFFGNTGKIDDLIPSIVKHKTEKYLVPDRKSVV